jgi:hypothetical protein
MTSKHEEFPELTHQAKCVLGQSINVSMPNWNRCFAAEVIREAITQTGVWNLSFRGQPSDVLFASELRAIADNLHALPPPPPTRERMEEALSSLFGQIVCHPESQFAQEAAILRSGIAHYCSPTP